MRYKLVLFTLLCFNFLYGQNLDFNKNNMFSNKEVIFIYEEILNSALEKNLSSLGYWILDFDTIKKNALIFRDSINIISQNKMNPYIDHIQAKFDHVDFDVIDRQIKDIPIKDLNFQFNNIENNLDTLLLKNLDVNNSVKSDDNLYYIFIHFSYIYQVGNVFVVVVEITTEVVSNKSLENHSHAVTEPILFVFERCPMNGMINFVRYYNLIFVGVPPLIEGRVNHKYNILAESCYCNY